MNIDYRLGIDAVILVFYFGVIGWIGLRMGRRDQTLEAFALGGRRIPWWAVLASIVAAETSAGTFLGTPGEGFELRNYTYLQLALGTILARIIVAYVFLKPFYDYKVCSIYEFLAVRFGEGTKNAASAVFLVTRVLASGTRLYIAAIILAVGVEMSIGRPLSHREQLMIYIIAVSIMTLLTTVYTSIGGIKAVIWTDLIQAGIMMGSALCAVFILLAMIPGHLRGVWSSLPPFSIHSFLTSGRVPGGSGWENLQHILATDYTIWAALLGSTFITLATHGTDQDMVQRMLTAPDYHRSRRSLICSGLADLPIVFIFLTIGILLWVFYQFHPDPDLPEKTNEVFPYFILKEMPVGFRGLMVAGVFATAMGSLSSALNALATTFTRDWYLPWRGAGGSESETVGAARRFTGIFGGLMILVASATASFVILYPHSRIIPIALGIFGYTYGSLLGIFLLGMLTKTRGCDRGNYLAMVTGFLVVALLSRLPDDLAQLFGGTPFHYPVWLPAIAFPWRIFFGTIVTFVVAVCFSGDNRRAENGLSA